MNDKRHEEASNTYREYLSRNKMFFTRERDRILIAVMKRSDHFSVDELLFDMQKEGQQVSRATLYRSLGQLADAGVLVEADFGHGHMHYEHVVSPHEHIVCRQCGKVFEVKSPELNLAIRKLAEDEGFQVNSHRTQIQANCQEFLKTGKCPRGDKE